MADQELIIKISGDPSDYKAAVHEASDSTEELKEGLKAIAELVAFAEITHKIHETIEAFHEQKVAVAQLEQALQNAGLAGKGFAEEYEHVAETIEKATGVSAAAIITAQAQAQALLGHQKVTEGLTKAVVDFAAAQKMDVASAFALVARAAENGTDILHRHGLQVIDSGSRTQRLADIQRALQTQFGGTAEAMANTTGSTARLHASFEELEKKIGEKLAPTFDKIVNMFTEFFNFLAEHDEMVNLAVSIGIAAVALGGYATAVSNAVFVTKIFKEAMVAMGLAADVASVSLRTLAGATGIGLLLVAIVEIYIHWNTFVPRMFAVWEGFVTALLGTGKAIREFVDALLHMDGAGMKQAALDAADAFKKGWEQATKEIKLPAPQVEHEKSQNAGAEKANAEAEAIKDRYEALERAKKHAQIEYLLLQDANATKETLELKKQEIDLLSQLEDQKNAAIFGILQQRLNHVRELQQEQYAVQLEQDDALNNELLAHNQAYQEMDAQQKAAFMEKNKAQLESQLITRRTQLQAAAKAEAEIQIKAHNQFLLDQQKFGTAYATINMAMHSAVVQGTKQAFGELAALQQSSNETLKSIGKVAAVANIIIRTAESAMNIYAGFSTIPIIGPALGVAGAAAAVAFGAEQISKVQGAAAGAVVEGGISGVDSVPFMLQQGELVSPRQNFEEVIGSVHAARAAEGMGLGGGDDQAVALLQSINEKVGASGGGNTVIIQGDAIGDPAWVQAMAKALSNGLEFDNLKIFGVSTGKPLI